MERDTPATYPRLDTLKRVTDDVWIVDGPTILFGPPLLKMSFSTRMTVIRIGADLLVHSPTRLTPELEAECRRPRPAARHRTQPDPLLVDSGLAQRLY